MIYKPDEKQACGLKQLENILKELIYKAGKGNFNGIETAVEQAGKLMDRIAKQKHTDQPVLRHKYQTIEELYRKLVLMTAAEQQGIDKRLKKISEHKKILTKYRIGAV